MEREVVVVEQKIRKKNNKKYVISFGVLLILIVVTMFILFKDYSAKELYDVLKTLDTKYIILASCMPLLYIFFQSFSCKMILRTLGHKSSMVNNIAYNSIDLYFCAITPSATGGQPMAFYYMLKDDIPSTKSIIALLLNTAAFRFVLLFLGIISLFFASNVVFNGKLTMPILFFIGVLINLVMVLICMSGIYHVNLIKKLGYKLLRFINKFRKKDINVILEKFDLKLKEYEKCGEFIKQHKILFLIVFTLNVFQRISYFLVSFFVYKAFGLSGATIFELLAAQIIIAVAVDSLPLPGGILITETLMLLAYELFYASELILPAMLVTRLCGYYFMLIVTMIIFIIKHITTIVKGNRKKDPIQENKMEIE